MSFVIKIFIMKLADLPTPVHSIVVMFGWVDIWVPVFLLASILSKSSSKLKASRRRASQSFVYFLKILLLY